MRRTISLPEAFRAMSNFSIHQSLLAVSASFASADELLVGSPNSAILTGSPYASDLQIVGACGGAVSSIALDGALAWIGDESGIVYRRDLATGAKRHPLVVEALDAR